MRRLSHLVSFEVFVVVRVATGILVVKQVGQWSSVGATVYWILSTMIVVSLWVPICNLS